MSDEDDWDLYAVVRGYNNAAPSATESPPAPATTINTASSDDTTLSSFATLTFKEENNDPFSFPNLVVQSNPTTNNTFQELHQLFVPFTSTTTIDTDQKQQQNQPHSTSDVNFLNLPSTPRSKKRKVQQKRMVCRVTADNLSADLWAWRKYGQKPIKGSPYPRNYYRCSSSKGCVARKQVERSVIEPDTFIVTYTGDHSHPPPTHRNSLAGSSRSKSSATQTNRTEGSDSPGKPGSSSSSSLLSSTKVITSPLDTKEAANEEPGSAIECPIPDPDSQPQEDSDDDILIPNMAVMTDDFFLDLHQDSGGSAAEK